MTDNETNNQHELADLCSRANVNRIEYLYLIEQKRKILSRFNGEQSPQLARINHQLDINKNRYGELDALFTKLGMKIYSRD